MIKINDLFKGNLLMVVSETSHTMKICGVTILKCQRKNVKVCKK